MPHARLAYFENAKRRHPPTPPLSGAFRVPAMFPVRFLQAVTLVCTEESRRHAPSACRKHDD